MWTTIISVVFGLIGKIFGIGKSDTQAAQESGEAQGKAEQVSQDESAILKDVLEANSARESVRDSPADDLRKPDEFSRD